MKFWTSLVLGIAGVALTLGTTVFDLDLAQSQMLQGMAFVTQSNSAHQGADYETSFGDNWQSVRTFKLLVPLDKPLKVYIDNHPGNPNLYQEHYRDYVVDGMNQWADALGNRLHYTLTAREKDADITVGWVPSFSDKYVAGLTTYSVGHATVEIKTIGVPDKDIKCNIIHELGHALGISGHSTNQNDVMVGMRKWHRDNVPYDPKLSARDVQAIRRLYSNTWQRGEDLFSADAQRMPILASLPTPGVQSAQGSQEALKTEVNSVAYHTASAQSRNVEPASTTMPAPMPVRPQYTQIFPKQ